MRKIAFLFIVTFFSFASLSATAAPLYEFIVNYDGDNQAYLAEGSADMLSTEVLSGGHIRYTLQAINGGEWQVLSDSDIFPFFSLSVRNSGSRLGNFSLDFFNDEYNVYSIYKSDVVNSFIHIGTNEIHLEKNFIFDSVVLNYAFKEGDSGFPDSLLPWPSKSIEFYSPDVIQYVKSSSPVPEPTSLLLMGFGFLIWTGLVRRS